MQYAHRVWGIDQGDDNVRIDEAIARRILSFEDLGVPTTLSRYETDGRAPKRVSEKLKGYDQKLGERKDITPEDVKEILASRS